MHELFVNRSTQIHGRRPARNAHRDRPDVGIRTEYVAALLATPKMRCLDESCDWTAKREREACFTGKTIESSVRATTVARPSGIEAREFVKGSFVGSVAIDNST